MKRVFSAMLAALCLAAAATTAHAAPLQAVNPQWSEEKQQVKAPAWNMTAEAIAAAKADERVAPVLEGMQVVKELYVPGKLVNIVVKPQ